MQSLSPLTDAEVLCSFMAPRPTVSLSEWKRSHPEDAWGDRHYPRWWLPPHHGAPDEWKPRLLTLNECHEIEARLTDDQWIAYRLAVCGIWQRIKGGPGLGTFYLHANAGTKEIALAAVLRPLVEARNAAK